MKASCLYTPRPSARTLVRFHRWSEITPERTEVFSARQYDDGDILLLVINHTAGTKVVYDDMVDEVLTILDKAEV